MLATTRHRHHHRSVNPTARHRVGQARLGDCHPTSTSTPCSVFPPARWRLVAATGWGQEDDKRRASDAGFDTHFTKPVSPGDVVRELALRREPAG